MVLGHKLEEPLRGSASKLSAAPGYWRDTTSYEGFLPHCFCHCQKKEE